MAYFNNNKSYSLASTFIFDVQAIQSVDVNSKDFKELLVNLYINIRDMLDNINSLDSGRYPLIEIINNQQWFNPKPTSLNDTYREDYRTTVNFGALPNTTIKSVPHGITVTNTLSWTKIYATATDPVGLTGIPIPYVDLSGNDIQINVDQTNINISTSSDYSNYTICYIVLEYLKY